MIGIYIIKNIVNGKVYIGHTHDNISRWRAHINSLKRGDHHSKKLQRSFNKHGIDNYLFEMIEYCHENNLADSEQYWIDFFDSYNKGYNCTPDAKVSWKTNNRTGCKLTNETKIKIKNSLIGHLTTEDTKNKISLSKKGKSNGCIGRSISQATRDKISATLKNKQNK